MSTVAGATSTVLESSLRVELNESGILNQLTASGTAVETSPNTVPIMSRISEFFANAEGADMPNTLRI